MVLAVTILSALPGGPDIVFGGAGVDTINGNGGADTLHGSADNDTIDGNDGNDTLLGGTGNDTLRGNAGVDQLNGGGGIYNGDAGNDLMFSGETMDGGIGIDTINHTAFNGYYVFNMATGLTNFVGESYLNFEHAIMGNGNGNDNVTGNASNNSIKGGGGADTLSGANGNDTIEGQSGNDLIFGGSGQDTLVCGDGRDVMSGGGDADTFDYNALSESTVGANRDVINDFTPETDKIDLSSIDAVSGAGDNTFIFRGTGSFIGGGEVRYFQDAVNNMTVVQAEFEGDGNIVVDMEIQLNGLHVLTAADFVL